MTDRPFRRQLVRNTLASVVANAWAMLAALAATPLLLAGLGRTGLGLWALVMTFSATNGWLSLGDLGVVVAVTREVSVRGSTDDTRGARQAVSAAVVVVLVLGTIFGAILALGAFSVLPEVFGAPSGLVRAFEVALAAMGVQVVLDLTINVFEGALEGIQRVDLSRAVDSFRRLVVVASTAVAALVTNDLRWVGLASLVATACSLCCAVAVLHHHMPRFLVRTTMPEVRSLLRHGREIALLRPLGVLQRTMDRILVGVVLGPSAVALVEVATQLQAGSDAVLSASSYSVMPSSSWLSARGEHEKASELALRGTKYSVLATLPAVVATATLAGPFIELWVGPRFSGAAGLVAVAVCAIAVNAPLAVGSQVLVGTGRTDVLLRCVALAVTVNIAVSLTMLYALGVVGVFIGTVVAGVLLTALLHRPALTASQLSAGEVWTKAIAPCLTPAAAQLVVALALLRVDLPALGSLALAGGGSLLAFVVVAARTAVDRGELRSLRGA